MKRFFIILLVAFAAGFCFADTFTNKDSGEILNGYSTVKQNGELTRVVTVEKGSIELDLSRWNVSYNANGRTNAVAVISIQGPIMLQIVSQAAENAILSAADSGPLFIIIEIDTPGGRVDLAQKICLAVKKATCPVYAFIQRGENSGAISAGAAVALACDKIYMEKGSVIGAAALITMKEGKPVELKEIVGEKIDEKFNSAWRGFLASLAEERQRPGLLARAMVDAETEVVEVNDMGKRLFIEPVNKKQSQKIVQTWNKKGSLLTLTALEAANCGIADKMVTARSDILEDANAANAKIVPDETIQKAQKEFDRAAAKASKLKNDIDFQAQRIGDARTVSEALAILSQAKKDFESLKKLAKQYPDLGMDIDILESRINTIEAESKSIKINTRRR